MSEHIYVVEDDDSIRRLLEFALESQGYVVSGFDHALDALEAMRLEKPVLTIMDVMMEGISGVEAVKIMRNSVDLKEIPVLMLSARDMEQDKITGLDAGADDYMTKPFSVLELCARVRALLRRLGGTQSEDAMYQCDGLELSPEKREVWVDGAVCELTYKEFEVLKYLMEHREKSVPRQTLLEQIWGSDSTETRTLDIHIGTLRQKIGDDVGASRFIKTVRGVGYRFVGGERQR